MSPAQWRLAWEIFQKARELPGPDRLIFASTASTDPEVSREVLTMLAAAADEESEEAPCPPPGRTGTKLGRYEIGALLGRGGMGEVYSARDTELDRAVAVKFLLPRTAGDRASARRSIREARAASLLNHPGIVTVYEMIQAGDGLAIAMELVEGTTLRELGQTALPLQEVVRLGRQIALALAAAHENGIVHRDVKPENLMVRQDGLVKVLDFGLAREFAGSPDFRQTSVSELAIGTPRYMAPEQLRGEPATGASDIFSLGIVLYELASGRHPFNAGNIWETAHAIAAVQPPPLSALNPSIPRSIASLIARMLDKNAGLRPSAGDVASILEGRNIPGQADAIESHTAPALLRHVLVAAGALLLVAIAVLGFYFHRRPAITDKDAVLLGEFANRTGDAVFDETLAQGLAVQLEQSPLLVIFPDARIRQTLRLMGRPPDEPVTEVVAREICQRQGLKAYIVGSIAPLGSHYAITLEAAAGYDGSTLARTQLEAESKEQVLRTLSKAASQLRQRLGESLGSVQKFDAMLERTTPSLEALRAYSMGRLQSRNGKNREAIALYRRAIELDPNFAYACGGLAVLYRNGRQLGLAKEYVGKAYALRNQVSERERLYITALYHELVTGDLGKNIEALRIFRQIYPQEPLPHNNLAVAYSSIGQPEQAVEEVSIAMRLDPSSSVRYGLLGNVLTHLNRYAEAARIYELAAEKKLDSLSIRRGLYRIAFVNRDNAAMDQQLQWANGSSNEDAAFDWQARGAAYFGHWRRSANYAHRAVDAATDGGVPELAVRYAAEAALRGAVLGRCAVAKAAASRKFSVETDTSEEDQVSLSRLGLALALCGETGEAQFKMEQLRKAYPENTLLNSIWLPAIQAAMELGSGKADRAVELLLPSVRYEAAAEFWPQYLRGQAYLRLGKAAEAAAEFGKILDHRGQDVSSPLYPLAHLGVARAKALQREAAGARASGERFLAEWKDADSDLPALIEARREFASAK